MEQVKKNGGWSKASLVLGIITMIFALLPMLSGWLMFLTIINYALALVGVICGVVAIVKRQKLAKSIIGLILCVLAVCMPFIFADCYMNSTVESMGNLFDAIG